MLCNRLLKHRTHHKLLVLLLVRHSLPRQGRGRKGSTTLHTAPVISSRTIDCLMDCCVFVLDINGNQVAKLQPDRNRFCSCSSRSQCPEDLQHHKIHHCRDCRSPDCQIVDTPLPRLQKLLSCPAPESRIPGTTLELSMCALLNSWVETTTGQQCGSHLSPSVDAK